MWQIILNDTESVYMKTIKLNYAGVGADFNKTQNLIYDVLKNNGYDVQISDDPD